MRFMVKLNGEVIGFSDIQAGDPSMGCAEGTFVPTAAYRAIQMHCIRCSEEDIWEPIPNLIVELENGVILECAGFQIVDFSDELGSEGIQLHLVGIINPRYREIFPEDFNNHVRRNLQ